MGQFSGFCKPAEHTETQSQRARHAVFPSCAVLTRSVTSDSL